MSKKYKGKQCVYCGKRVSTTGDHVVAREFMPPDSRTGIPIVPSCDKCNNEKSTLELYATTILPFGSKTKYSNTMLKNSVSRRLNRNNKLKKELRDAAKHILVGNKEGIVVPVFTVPMKLDIIIKLVKFIVKGLAYYHWRCIVPRNYNVEIKSLDLQTAVYFKDNVLSMSPENYIEGNIGDGCFRYGCTRASDDPNISVWAIDFYNGITMARTTENGSVQQLYFSCWIGPNNIIHAT